jgi:[protein-PII] uridylyltransferase
MPVGSRLRESVLTARQELAEGRERLRQQHDRSLDGIKVCGRLTSLVDGTVTRLYDAALADRPEREANELRQRIALVAHGGYGRRQQAPYSDVDLMILHEGRVDTLVSDFARRVTQDIFDVGVQLGQSVRTSAQAIQLARSEPQIGSSLLESRLMVGDSAVYQRFSESMSSMTQRRKATLSRDLISSRREEREKFGESVYLLEPNIKRSRGGLRDLHLLRWLWYLRCGVADFDRLHDMGVLSKFDHRRLMTSLLFLLRVRNEMHFHAGEPCDQLSRVEQVRLAEYLQYRGRRGLLPVEQFMRDYFHHTNHVWQLANRLSHLVQPASRVSRVFGPVLGRTTDDGYHIGRREISATTQAMARLERRLEEVLRLVDLARNEGKRIAQDTWYFVYRSAPHYTGELSDAARTLFLDILAKPVRLGELLRRLHDLGVLEKIVPDFAHARSLLQFNQYHKYTVDEHSIRAVEEATMFADRHDSLAELYRRRTDLGMLHLALLLHDLGKGYEEDHSEVGRRIAQRMAERLRLTPHDAGLLEFLIHKHLVMSHLAFRRDTSQPELVARFAEEVETVQRLDLLALVTCADLAAVGPGVLNSWKIEVLLELHRRALRQLSADRGAVVEDRRERARHVTLRLLAPEEQANPWFQRQLNALSETFIARRSPEEVSAMLRRLHQMKAENKVTTAASAASANNATDGSSAALVTLTWTKYIPETDTVEFLACVDQGSGRGVFSSMAGALTSHGMQILSAEISTLADGLLLLEYTVQDPDYADEPPADRLSAVTRSLVESVGRDEPPKFRKMWGRDQREAMAALANLPNEVRIDTALSDECAIVEVFTIDRRGLLYRLARALHDLGLVIRFAKIGTYLDQVVDVFYVAERDDTKPTSEERLAEICARLLEIIAPPE